MKVVWPAANAIVAQRCAADLLMGDTQGPEGRGSETHAPEVLFRGTFFNECYKLGFTPRSGGFHGSIRDHQERLGHEVS